MLTGEDMPPLPECRCIKVDGGRITNSCDLHNPFNGLLVEQPVEFTGMLSVLETEGLSHRPCDQRDPEDRTKHGD